MCLSLLLSESSTGDVLHDDHVRQISFPTISLNIKISPESLIGNSPVTVVADVQPLPNLHKETKTKTVDIKRKSDSSDNDDHPKRIREDVPRPVNLTSDNVRSTETLFKLTDKFKNLKRSIGSINTAVVLPRSDRTDVNKIPAPPSDISVSTSGSGIKTNKPRTTNNDNIGYLVPTSYPYLNPNCFAQDARLLMTAANIIPQMAHSGVHTSFPYLQSSFRNIAPKVANQPKE